LFANQRMVSFPNGATSQNLEDPDSMFSSDRQQVVWALPSIKLVDSIGRVGSENLEYMGEKGLPHSKFKLVQ